jgi:uncharacterized membrane protein
MPWNPHGYRIQSKQLAELVIAMRDTNRMNPTERRVVAVVIAVSLAGAFYGLWVAIANWDEIPAYLPFAIIATAGGIVAAVGLFRSSLMLAGIGLVLGAFAPTGFAWIPSALAGAVGVGLLIQNSRNSSRTG